MGEASILLSREARGGHALSYLERQWGAIISLIRSLHLFSLSRGVLSPLRERRGMPPAPFLSRDKGRSSNLLSREARVDHPLSCSSLPSSRGVAITSLRREPLLPHWRDARGTILCILLERKGTVIMVDTGLTDV